MSSVNTDPKKLYKHIEYLTSFHPPRNFENPNVLEEICKYFLKPYGGYTQAWKVKNQEYKNVILTYNRGKEKRLIIGAHYDVCGEQDGADDNASGVAGLMETARLLFENQPELDYQVDLVFYCLEEPPFFASEYMGSYIHAKSLSEEKVEVIGMICYEMIGYFSEEPNSQKLPTPALEKLYPDKGNFIAVVGMEEYKDFNAKVKSHLSKVANIDVHGIDFPTSNGLAGMSDHKNYWKFGYPALMINDTSFMRNPHYHQKTDTIDTLDCEKMAEVVNGVYSAVVNF
jgi:Zn-dependent M28 family amino/carboxypeptidase